MSDGINMEFEDDLSIVITAIENGDTKDAVQMLKEIQAEEKEVIKELILN